MIVLYIISGIIILGLVYINWFSRSANYDHRGQRLTKELIEKYREQDKLDKESCFDKINIQ